MAQATALILNSTETDMPGRPYDVCSWGVERTCRASGDTSGFVKVFGCRPMMNGAAHSGAGVRKPPREETAGDVARRCVRRYGDFGVRSVGEMR